MSNSSLENEKLETQLSTALSNAQEKFGITEVITTVISPGGKEVEITGEVDEAMKLAEAAKFVEYTKEEEDKLIRKIDLYLMPFFIFLYAVQYMDKISNSFASIMGLKTDLNMVGQEYSWLGSAFYLGYLVFELPSTLILQRFPVAKATSVFIFVWGVLTCFAPLAQNYAGFCALRVLLGMSESAITPCMVILTSQWYRKDQQFLRSVGWVSGCFLGLILGYAFAYGLYIHGEHWAIHSWKVVYIVIGLTDVAFAIAFYFHIPDNPSQAWFLNEREKLIVVDRIRVNNQGFGNRHFKWSQLKECLTDYRIWVMFAYSIIDEVPNGGLTNFSSILLNEDFAYSVKKSLVMNIPLGVYGFFITCFMAYLYTFGIVKHRFVVATLSMAMALFGSCLLAFVDNNKHAKLAGYYIMQVSDMGFACVLSSFESNVAGHTKKVVGNAMFLIAYCVGNVIGPQTFRSNEAPHFQTAKGAIVGCYAADIICINILYFSYYFDNRRRDKLKEQTGDSYVEVENIEFADLTDKENPEFRYSL